MRVMVFVKATEDSEKGVLPTTEAFEAMGRFNEELVKAGVMLAGARICLRKLYRLAVERIGEAQTCYSLCQLLTDRLSF